MHKFFYISILFACSCSPFFLNSEGYKENEMRLEDAWKIVSSYEYIEDEHGNSYLKSPKQFESDGGGDCEDFAAYMMYLLGKDSTMVIMIVGEEYHAIVFYNGFYLEPQVYSIYYNDVNIYKVFNYDYVMQKATKYGSKDL